jgi:hypothetical protein
MMRVVARPVLAGFAVWLALAAILPAHAEQPKNTRVERVEVVESGFYTGRKVKETPAAGTVLGHVDDIEGVEFLKQAPAVTAKVGTAMGVRFKVIGKPAKGQAQLRTVWHIPEPGIHNPKNNNTYRQSTVEFSVKIGDTPVRGYSFDEPWEVIKGTWTLELFQDDRKLLEKSFVIE